MSETSKYRDLTVPYCNGNIVDIGSQGDPVVPWAIQIELPAGEYAHYTSGKVLDQAGVWRGDGRALPFRDATMDTVYSSHLLEDFFNWRPILTEWWRVVKPSGYLVVLIPDSKLWDAAIAKGQTPNCAHQHCGHQGELTATFAKIDPRAEIREDRLTLLFPGDYTILFVARKR